MYVYVINLEPAVMTLPFGVSIDIRDTMRNKNVMKKYGLGPMRKFSSHRLILYLCSW